MPGTALRAEDRHARANRRLASCAAPTRKDEPARIHSAEVLRCLVAEPTVRARDDDGLAF